MTLHDVRRGLMVVLAAGILGALPLSLTGCESSAPDGAMVVPEKKPMDVMKDSMKEIVKKPEKPASK